jgi:hypothetical protein
MMRVSEGRDRPVRAVDATIGLCLSTIVGLGWTPDTDEATHGR